MPEPSTEFQKTIGKAIGLELAKDSNRVAAARIRKMIAEAINEKPDSEPSTDRQIDYAKSLGLSIEHETKGVASAIIEDKLHDLNMDALKRLALKPGDKVQHISRFRIDGVQREHVTEEVVSSISSSGRVFFKGVGCKSGWPTNVKKKK